MNTLNKTITSSFFCHENGYDLLISVWSKAVNDPEVKKTLTSSHHLAYAVLRGKDFRKAFTPITDANKLANGSWEHQGYSIAWERLAYALNHPVFGSLTNKDTLKLMRAVLPFTKDFDGGYIEPTI
jgi:hypothetical protein